MKNTTTVFKMVDGTEVGLTLNFARLLKVKNYNKRLYEDFMKALKSDKDFDIIFDSIKILYVAYLCSQADDLKNVMTEEEFVELIPSDMALINNAVAELIAPKKK